MIDGKFDVVFRGQIVRGLDESVVKSNLVTLFKSSPEAVDKLFNGNEVVVRKELDYATAMKYQSALKKAGALALIKEIEQKTVAAQQSQGKGNESAGAQDGLTVAEPGAQILPDKIYEKREVDTSQLSLASVGERILPAKPPEDHPKPSIEHLKLEE